MWLFPSDYSSYSAMAGILSAFLLWYAIISNM